MGRLNNYIKAAILHSTTLFAIVGISFIVLAVFILASNWGSLDKDFFLGWGILIIFFGFFLFLISMVGYMGVRFQRKRIGFWKGRRIIGLFQIVLIGTLIAELWMVIKMASAVTSLEDSRDSIQENPSQALEYDSLEKNVATRFNDFYFGAVDGCYDAKYVWFWTWLNDHCVDGLGAERCRSCGDFSATTCLADLETCYTSENEAGPTCPYQICRENTLSFIIASFKPIYLYALIFSAFHLLLIILGCALMCFTERDTLEVMLTKTGTITQTAAKMRGADEEGLNMAPPPGSTNKARRGSAQREEEPRAAAGAAGGASLVRQDAKGGGKKKKDQSGAIVARQRHGENEIELV